MEKTKFQRATIAYIISGVLSKGITVFTMPLFTRWLSLEDMGTVTTFNSWLVILYTIVSLSLAAGSVNVAMMEYEECRDKYLSAVLTFSSCSTLIALIIFVLFKELWIDITTLSGEYSAVFFAYFLVQPALDLWYAKNRFENKYLRVAVLSIVQALLSGIVSILSVYLAKEIYDINLAITLIYSQYGVGIIIGFLIFLIIIYKGKTLFDFQIWKWAFSLSWPLIIHAISKNILDVSDRLMISQFRGKAEAGLYGTIYTICNMPLIIWTAINNAIIPLMFEKLHEKEEKQLQVVIEKVILLFGIMIVGASLISPEILFILVDPKYYEAVTIMPVLFLGIFFTAIYNVFGNFLLYQKKTKCIMIGTVSSVVVNIVLNLILLEKWGYKVASYTTLISCILLCIMQAMMCVGVYRERFIKVKGIIFISIFIIILSLSTLFLFKFKIVRYFLFAICAIILVKVYATVKGNNV